MKADFSTEKYKVLIVNRIDELFSVDIENGIFYNSTVEASKLLGISFSRLEYNLKKHNKYNNLVFAWK